MTLTIEASIDKNFVVRIQNEKKEDKRTVHEGR